MIKRHALALMGTLLACTRTTVVPELSPQPEPQPQPRPSVARLVASDAPMDPPCGLLDITTEQLPDAELARWHVLSGTFAYAASEAETATLVYTAANHAWRSAGIDAARQITSDSGHFGATQLGTVVPFDFSLTTRWAHASELHNEHEDIDVLVGDLRDPAAFVVVDATPEHDADPVIVAAHGGGWAIAWKRGRERYPHPDIYFALIDENMHVSHVSALETDAYPDGMDVVATPQGYVVVYGVDPMLRGEPRLAALFVDTRAELLARVVLDDVPATLISTARDPRGVGILYEQGPGPGFARIGFDGQVLSEPHLIWRGSGEVRATALLFHRGQYWAGFSTRDANSRGECLDRAHARVVPVLADGEAGLAIEWPGRDCSPIGVTLGRLGNDVIVAWTPDDGEVPLHQAILRCPT